MNKENLLLLPQYERIRCSYMIKELIPPPKRNMN